MSIFRKNIPAFSLVYLNISKISFTICVMLVCIAGSAYSQNVSSRLRYADETYFKDEMVKYTDTIIYGTAKDFSGNTIRLGMTIFYPDISCDSLKKRPLIMLVHGGSYIHGNKYDMYHEALLLGKRGFVVASIN